jgi:hypothetical protein
MSARALCAAAAVAISALVALSVDATAKDDPATIKANREAVRKKFKDAKKYPFGDLSYFCDSTKLKDARWEFRDHAEPTGVDDNHAVFSASFPSGNASDPTPSIDFLVFRMCHHKDVGGGKRQPFSYTFKSWGKSVPISDVKDMATGFYEDWIREAQDVIKDKSQATKKTKVGPADYWGYAVGTDSETKKRVRKDWYLWVDNGGEVPFTFIAQFTTADRFIDADDGKWVDKIAELMKSLQELKDPKLK